MWYLDPSSHLATTDIGRKLGVKFFLVGERGCHLTMLPGPRSTSLPSGILIHPAICPHHISAESWGWLCPLFWGRWVPCDTVWPGPRPTPHTKWQLDPGSCLATIHGPKLEVLCPPFWGEGVGSPSNTMSPGPRPTSVPGFILIHPTVWPQYTNVTDRTDRHTDR